MLLPNLNNNLIGKKRKWHTVLTNNLCPLFQLNIELQDKTVVLFYTAGVQLETQQNFILYPVPE